MRLIDADVVIDVIFKKCDEYDFDDDYCSGIMDGLEKAIKLVDEQPTIDLLKHGEWQHKEGCPLNYFECSLCGNEHVATFDHNDNFCSNCGAKMDGDSK